MSNLPDYDSVKLVSLLKQCGTYRDQLVRVMQFLHRTGALGIYQNWLDTKLNVDPQPLQEGTPPPVEREMSPEDSAMWDRLFREPYKKTVSINHDHHPDEVARLFCEKLNELHRFGISCEEVIEDENVPTIDYIISVERETEEDKEVAVRELVADYMSRRPMVGIALCIIRDGKVLLHKRKGKHAPGSWAFTGGHLEKFETFEETALRETAEEAGPDIKVKNVRFWTAANTMFQDEDKHYVVIFLVADWVSGEAKVMEPDKCECWEWHDWNNMPQPLMLGLQDLKQRNLSPMDV